jgi:hypothetical protein
MTRRGSDDEKLRVGGTIRSSKARENLVSAGRLNTRSLPIGKLYIHSIHRRNKNE